jgi:hypothetical protein
VTPTDLAPVEILAIAFVVSLVIYILWKHLRRGK